MLWMSEGREFLCTSRKSVGQRLLTWEMSVEERSCLEGLCTVRSKHIKGSRERYILGQNKGVNASSHSCFRFLYCGVREIGRRAVREVVTNNNNNNNVHLSCAHQRPERSHDTY